MTTISAQTVLRSRNSAAPNHVVSTLLLRYPRWIHAEDRTHRVISLDEDWEISEKTPSLMHDPNLSRNAASSRAIPVSKMIEDVMSNPAIPLFWGKNQKGMQADEEFGPEEQELLRSMWIEDMKIAITRALRYEKMGVHKQIVNRILEPYSHITVLATATEWDNFLELRDHSDAEPHIQVLAREIKKCLEFDPIQTLSPGNWHLPFVRDDDREIWSYVEDNRLPGPVMLDTAIKKSVACCASTSYKTVDGFDMTVDRAIALHDRLVGSRPLHASPCEHVCQADEYRELRIGSEFLVGKWGHADEHGNFRGFRQYRKMLEKSTQVS